VIDYEDQLLHQSSTVLGWESRLRNDL